MEKLSGNVLKNAEEEDFSSMTCSSIPAEEIVAQQKRRQERQARTPSEGYPGLAFGTGISGSTMMRLRVIANELHNISSVVLKRVEGEMNALEKRIETVDTELKNEEIALKEANDGITEISEELGPEPQEKDEPGDERLNEIEGLRSRLELIKAMYDLSS